MPITPTGYVAPDIADLRSEFRTRFESTVDWSPTWNDDDVLTILSEVMLSVMMEHVEAVQAIYDAYSLNNARDRALENIGSLHLLTRNPATRSRVAVSLGGTAGVVLQPGTLIENPATRERWRLVSTVTLPDAGVFESVEPGPVPAASGTPWKRVTLVTGWDTAANTAPALLGAWEERDDEFLQRILRSFESGDAGTVGAIQAQIEALTWVSGVLVLENTGNTTVVQGPYVMPPHSVLAMVMPSVISPDERQELVDLLARSVPAGISTAGSEVGVSLVDGVEYTERFGFAEQVPVSVTVGVSLFPGYVVMDVEQQVIDAVTGYFATLRIGGDVLQLPMLGDISAIRGVRSVSLTPNDTALQPHQLAVLAGVTVYEL